MFESINVLSLFTEKQRAVKVKQKSMISMIMLDDIDAEVTKKKINNRKAMSAIDPACFCTIPYESKENSCFRAIQA